MGVTPAGAAAGARPRRAARGCRTWPARCSCTTRWSTTRCALVLATRDAGRARPARRRRLDRLRRHPARLARHRRRRPGAGADARPRLRAAAGRLRRHPRTCCATGWCSSYDALADGVSVEPRRSPGCCRPSPLPQVNAVRSKAIRWRPPMPRRRRRPAVGDRASASAGPVDLPSLQRGEIRDPALSAALRKLELTVRRKLDGLLQGDHLGLVPGPGTEPGESRDYQPGDDVRRMDWAVTARTTEPHVRQTDRRPGAGDLAGGRPVAPASTSAPPAARSATWPSPRPPPSRT